VAGALDVPPDADPRELTHGFHSYPARFHPLLPRRLLATLPRGATVLDPFVGSGTALVEAVRVGARAVGSDVNPLAVELARLKATLQTPAQLDALVERAHAISERSLDRVKRRARTKESGDRFDDVKLYAPHVFRELVGLREEIDAEPEPRMPLLLLLTSMVVKLSRQRADTSEAIVERAIGKGMASRLYARKAEELARGLRALAAAAPPGTPPPDVRLADARKLAFVPDGSVDVVITSPPYLGTYDYTQQHARRLGWLGLHAREFDAREIGSRRRAVSPSQALATWQNDVDAFVGELARVLRPGGRIFVAIGDSAVGPEVVPGDLAIRRAAGRAGLRLTAGAHQARPSFYAPARRATRREHLLLLER
jgi:DNA modification methylase